MFISYFYLHLQPRGVQDQHSSPSCWHTILESSSLLNPSSWPILALLWMRNMKMKRGSWSRICSAVIMMWRVKEENFLTLLKIKVSHHIFICICYDFFLQKMGLVGLFFTTWELEYFVRLLLMGQMNFVLIQTLFRHFAMFILFNWSRLWEWELVR